MRNLDVEGLKKKAHEEYAQEKLALQRRMADLDEHYQAIQRALDWIEDAAKGDTESASQPGVSAHIRSAVSEINGVKFTRKDVQNRLQKSGQTVPTRSVLNKELDRLVSEGILKIAVVGRGRRATQYARLAQ